MAGLFYVEPVEQGEQNGSAKLAVTASFGSPAGLPASEGHRGAPPRHVRTETGSESTIVVGSRAASRAASSLKRLCTLPGRHREASWQIRRGRSCSPCDRDRVEADPDPVRAVYGKMLPAAILHLRKLRFRRDEEGGASFASLGRSRWYV